ncbi:MAG: SdrD B-like domain-containing protein [Deinococcota bacterium]
MTFKKRVQTILMVLVLVSLTTLVQAQDSRPVPLPEASFSVPSAPQYSLTRTVTPGLLVPGQTADVTINVQHEGSADRFVLQEQLPVGLKVVSVDNGGDHEGRTVRWRPSSDLTSNRQTSYSYRVRMLCSAPPLLAWQGALGSPVVSDAVPPALLERSDLDIRLLTDSLRVDESGALQLQISNPTDQAIELSLELVPGPINSYVSFDATTVSTSLGAGEETVLELPASGLRIGASDLTLQPSVAGTATCPVTLPIVVQAPPSLPEAVVTTTLELDISTVGISNLTGLAVVVPLAEGVEVMPDSSERIDEAKRVHPLADPRIDARRLDEVTARSRMTDTEMDDVADDAMSTSEASDESSADETMSTDNIAADNMAASEDISEMISPINPLDATDTDVDSAEDDVIIYPKAAVFVIDEDLGTRQILRFTVSHQSDFRMDPSLSSLVGLTPDPFLIVGLDNAVERYLRAVPDTRVPDVAIIREGAVIVSPAEGTLLRSGNTTTVRIDAPLTDNIKLFVEPQNLPDVAPADARRQVDAAQVGQQVRDNVLGRQTLDFIGVTLEQGDNLIVLESTSSSDEVLRDERIITVSGPAASLSLRPLTELLADSAEPLRFALDVRDALGNIPNDGMVTLELIGANPLTPDAEPQQLGYQVRHSNGQALFELVPVAEPREIIILGSFDATVSGQVETAVLEETLVIDSNVRSWIVNGIGSVGVAIEDDFAIDAAASVFARGRLFDDYLITFSVNYPFDELGRFGDPYESFPVPGSSGELSQDAQSRDGVFVRLERNLSFVQYGEFDTGLDSSLVDLSRSYTGFSGEYRRSQGGLFMRGFAAYVPVGDAVNDLDIPGDGTTFYELPGAPIEEGSLVAEVIKRNAFDPNLPEDEDDRLIQDGDPLVGPLVELRDYTLDETLGFIRLSRPLPPIDSEGNRYFLRVSYRREASTDSRDWQVGGVVGYEERLSETETATVSVSGYRESTDAREVNVVAARGELDLDGLEADLEIAYGTDSRDATTQDDSAEVDDGTVSDGGLGIATGVRYETDVVDAEVRYQYLDESFRSAEVDRASRTGHSLDAEVEVLLARYLGVGFDVMWKDSPASRPTVDDTRDRDYAADVYVIFTEEGDFGIADQLEAEAGIGIRNDVPRLRLGVSFTNLVGIDGIRADLRHLQSLGDEPSVSELTLSHEIFENLSLEVTDRLEWGVNNALLVGLVSRFDNGDLFGSAANFGSTQLRAQYELTQGLSNTGGSVRLGASTSYALNNELSFEGSFDQILDLDDDDGTDGLTGNTGDATILAAAVRYDTPDFDGQLRYEVRFDDRGTKHVGNLGTNMALSNRLFVSLTADLVLDDTRDANLGSDMGLRASAAAAYRGEVINLLTNNTLDTGLFDEAGGTVLEGDWRVDLPIHELLDLDPHITLRAGYAYRYRDSGANDNTDLDDSGFRDMISVGASVEPWQGGALTGYARLYNNWTDDETAWGFTLEASQRIACGSYGVVGYSFDDIPDPVFSQDGLQVRLDVVADEQWRCGGGDISGYVFVDENADGLSESDLTHDSEVDSAMKEPGLTGIVIRLYDTAGRLVASTESDAGGKYVFEDVDVDRDYLVTAVLPRGYSFSPRVINTLTSINSVDDVNDIDDDDLRAIDSDINPDTGSTDPFRVGRFRDTRHLDVGLIPDGRAASEAQP